MWGSASNELASAAEQQAKLHAQHAASGDGFDAAPPESFFEDARRVTLRPGSVLYHPAGTWHRVQALDDSLSINISLMASNLADLIADALRQRLLCHADARAPLCISSIADGRRQLERVLATLPGIVNQLTPEQILPCALALPRIVRLPLPPTHRFGRRRVTESSRFSRNPLAVLVRTSERAAEESGESGESGDNDDDEGEEGDLDGEGEGSDGSDCEGGGALVQQSDLFLDGGSGEPGAVQYVLHSHFGREDYASLIRVELPTPPALQALLEWCRTVSPTVDDGGAPVIFTARRVMRSGGAGLPFETVGAVLDALEHFGYLCRYRPSR